MLDVYTKYQVALQYFPDMEDSPNAAVHKLRQWIVNCHSLYQELLNVGYNPKSKCFTKKQLQLVYEYLGEP